MKSTLRVVALLFFAVSVHADEFSYVFVDPKVPQDTLVVIADNYDEALDAYCHAQHTTRAAVHKRFQIFDGGWINAAKELNLQKDESERG